jgi:hypothetical protein
MVTRSSDCCYANRPGDSGTTGPLAAGERRDGTLRGSVNATPDQAFVAFTDPDDNFVFVVPTN